MSVMCGNKNVHSLKLKLSSSVMQAAFSVVQNPHTATILDNVHRENFYHCSRYCRAALVWRHLYPLPTGILSRPPTQLGILDLQPWSVFCVFLVHLPLRLPISVVASGLLGEPPVQIRWLWPCWQRPFFSVVSGLGCQERDRGLPSPQRVDVTCRNRAERCLKEYVPPWKG